MNRTLFYTAALALTLAACTPVAPAPVPPKPDVTTLLPSGPGSLLEPLTQAQPGATLKIQSTLSGTLDLSSGPLILAKNVTLEGPSTFVLSGGGKGRVLEVRSGSKVTLKGIALENGKAVTPPVKAAALGALEDGGNYCGGVLLNAGEVTLENVEVRGGVALAGGGICNIDGAKLTLRNSLVRNNTAGGVDTFG